MITNKIYYEDSTNLSKEIPDNYLDLIITSPPYADIKNYGKKINNFSPDNYNDWMIPIVKEIGRSLKDSGSFILNINDKVVGGFRHLYVFNLVIRICNETDLKLYDRYIWHKKNALPGSGNRLNDWMEYIFHFSKTSQIKNNIDQVREPYAESTIKRYKSPVAFNKKTNDDGITSIGDKKMVKQNPLGKKPSTVMRFNNAGILKGGIAGKHPAPFHPDLPEFFIKWLTDENDIVLDPFMGCYDSKTRVMTNDGLKFFKDLTSEKILTLNPENNRIEYQNILKKFQYEYKGDMYQFKGKSYDLLVTPNHNMYVKEAHKNNYELIEANKLNHRTYKIPISGDWKGTNTDHFELPIYEPNRSNQFSKSNLNSLRIDIKIWLAFMGLYLSEGNIGGSKKQKDYVCCITQKIDMPEIRYVLDNLPFKYKKHGMKYHIYSTRLCKYLKRFGKSHDKFIPNDLKNLDKELLRIFLNYFNIGDVSTYSYDINNRKLYIKNLAEFTNRDYEYYWTCSNKLKDDIIELLIKCGYNATYDYKIKNSVINGRIIKVGAYEIRKSLSTNRKIDMIKHVKIIPYDGVVYCVNVQNHVMMVERYGKLVWCGNSGTVAEVCKNLNRQYIGFELNESYKELIDLRLNE